MIKLHDLDISGNCYKVRLFLAVLGLEHERVPVDVMAGEHKSPEFLKLNPLGQIPVLVDGEHVLRDSQAILAYLARRYADETWLPLEPAALAAVMEWLSVAANELEHGPYAARLGCQLKLPVDVPAAQEKARAVLAVVEAHLQDRAWLAGGHPTIADIACYPAIALAPHGEVSLEPFPNIGAWLGRVRGLPNYEPMPGIE